MQYEHITNDRQLQQYCQKLAGQQRIALDTEFVSEHTYRPVLCLVQVTTGEDMAVIDAPAVNDMTCFWEALAEPGHQTIVHAGRGEVEFCLDAVGRLPAALFDVQVAAGLVGVEYPAAYSTLLSKLLGEYSQKQETRTDWRRRPLSQRQIEYALNDVRHLIPLRDLLHQRLGELGRLEWLDEEMVTWQEDVQRAASEERWRRISGVSALSGRCLAIARELYHWREVEARRRNQPARRVLRDDLIIELARRQTADARQICAVRGLERNDLVKRVDEIAASIQRALDLPEVQYPARIPRDQMPQLSVVGQFLFVALGSLCRQAQLAPNLVGGPNDIRELVAHRMSGRATIAPVSATGGRGTGGERPAESSPEATPQRPLAESRRRRPPRLAQGWREQFLGHFFDDLLSGKTTIRIGDPTSDQPLVFESE